MSIWKIGIKLDEIRLDKGCQNSIKKCFKEVNVG